MFQLLAQTHLPGVGTCIIQVQRQPEQVRQKRPCSGLVRVSAHPKPSKVKKPTCVYRTKGALPWGDTRTDKLQVSMYLPNHKPMEAWYTSIQNLSAVWPEISMLGSENLRRVIGHDFHEIRGQFKASGMWGRITPNRELLLYHLEATGPGPLETELQEKLFSDRSLRHGQDIKELDSNGKAKSNISSWGGSRALHLSLLLKRKF